MESFVQNHADGGSSLDKIAWLIFCATCVYLASLQPYVVLIPGERGNVFAGFLCAFTLASALLVTRQASVRATSTEILISLGLLTLAVASGLMSSTPRSSFIRVLVVMSAGLGGFWCARIFLNSPPRQKAFAWLCSAMLSGIIFLSLWGYYAYGRVDYYLYWNSHQVINMAFLLLVGPLALMSRRKLLGIVLGVPLAAFCGIVLFLAAVQSQISGVMVPLGVVFFLAFLAVFRSKTVVGQFLLLMAAVAVTSYFMTYLSRKDTSSIEYQAYRIESYPFSWHIVKQHPMLGVGLRSPRDELLADYEVRHPALAKEQFAYELHTLVTPENALLALLTGMGLPFFILYGFALTLLLAWLAKNSYRPPPADRALPPWALLVPLLGSLLHSLTTDTLLLPQIVWYFHLILGLIPKPEAAATKYRVSWESIGVRIAGLAGAVALGIFLGTQPYFSPEKLPTAETIHAYLKEVPLIKLLYYEKERPSMIDEKTAALDGTRAGQQPYGLAPGDARLGSYGTLVVNIDGYKGVPVNWAIMVILDNSKSMAEELGPGGKTRRDVALEVIASLADSLSPASKVALRAFSYEGIARKKSKEIPLRVSRMFVDWTDGPVRELSAPLNRITFAGTNNICTATRRSIRRDFLSVGELTRRIVLVTDGRHECSFKDAIRTIEKERLKDETKLDVIAIDMPRPVQPAYSKLSTDTGGLFLDAVPVAGAGEILSRYLAVLQEPRPQPLEVLAGKTRHKILPGRESRLLPGSYTIALPEIEGLDSSNRAVKNVRVMTGKTTVLNISAQQGRLVVQ